MLSKHPFWDELAAVRREGRPHAWRSPLGGPVVTPEQLFDALLGVARLRSVADGALPQRLYAQARPVPMDDALFPVEADGSTEGYVRRLVATQGESGFVVNDVQASCPALWRAAIGICAGLQRALGVSPGGTSVELFAGDYRTGFFGVHKDDQEVVTFVIEGRKRFLLWPYHVLADRPEVPAGSQDKVVLMPGVDPSTLRAQAIVLEGEPGDVFYWPADHWHVAESDGGLCTSLGVGLFVRPNPTHLLEEAVQELVDEGTLPRPAELPAPLRQGGDASALLDAALGSLGAALDHPELHRRLDEKVLRTATSFGYHRLLCRAEAEIVPEGCVQVLEPSLLAWVVRGDELVWSVSGAVYRYPAVPALVTLISRLASGEVIDVAQAVAELSAHVEPDALRHTLALVARHHALAPAQVSAAPALRG